jgi:hypothetical protein
VLGNGRENSIDGELEISSLRCVLTSQLPESGKQNRMTTFTRIPEEETPSISVDVSRRLSKIGNAIKCQDLQNEVLNFRTDPMIYGGFMEYVYSSLSFFWECSAGAPRA